LAGGFFGTNWIIYYLKKPYQRQPMNFQLASGESLAEGIRRIALKRIDIALAQLTNPDFNRDQAVHDARKTCKRLRAILRLVRDEVGYTYYRQENVRFRDASRLLSPARDSAVMIEALDSLIQRFQDLQEDNEERQGLETAVFPFLPLPNNLFVSLREKLLERHHQYSRQVLETDAVPNFITTFRAARLQVSRWPIQNEEFGMIASGLHRVYKRGRKRMATAQENTTAATLHDWRKRVKYLWYQLELIQPISPTALSQLADALHTLSSHLGDEHDLAELQRLIITTPNLLPNPTYQDILFTMIDFRRKEYQRLAWSVGQHLFEEHPDDFVQRLRLDWQLWCYKTLRANIEKYSLKNSQHSGGSPFSQP